MAIADRVAPEVSKLGALLVAPTGVSFSIAHEAEANARDSLFLANCVTQV